MNSAIWSPRVRKAFAQKLLDWYDGNGRDLPWREIKDPYRVWISEIMLQQTRVGAVLDHYRRFLKRFPTIETLARAREQSVLAAWSGLGYYRRARRLHACAKAVVLENGGRFPETVEGLRALPGIGRYTAAAIASIAFNETVPVVDGNVERVLARITGDPEIREPDKWKLAGTLLNESRPGDFNQAMMELGATVCLPREPRCLTCPVMKYCATRGPLATAKKEQRISQPIALSLARKNDSVWLVQRGKGESLMPGMWELPEAIANGHSPAEVMKHSILKTNFVVSVYLSEASAGKGKWVKQNQLARTALTGLSRKVLRHFALL